jgi:uncharacterized protein
MSDVRGAFVHTLSGTKFFPYDPNPEEVIIRDVAHSLARQPRYNGHTRKFYSVAQHSLILSYFIEELGAEHLALDALLHDATEAYIGDMVNPLKVTIPVFSELEDKIFGAVALRFQLHNPMPRTLMALDRVMVYHEVMSFGPVSEEWVRAQSDCPKHFRRIVPLPSWLVKALFLCRFWELYDEETPTWWKRWGINKFLAGLNRKVYQLSAKRLLF